MAEAVFRCFFPGRVRLFGKTNGHSRKSLATNAAGKNALLQGENKAERNCRRAQGAQQIKGRSCRTKNEPPHFLRGISYGLANGGLPRTERQPAGLIAHPAGQGRAVRPAHTPQIKKKTPPDKLGEFPFLCRWWGSNPHVLLAQGILSPPRLPFRHTGASFLNDFYYTGFPG